MAILRILIATLPCKVDAATAAAHQRTWDATEAGLALIEQGHATCASVFSAMQAVLMPGADRHATSSVGRLGHGLGIQLTETPSITDTGYELLSTRAPRDIPVID